MKKTPRVWSRTAAMRRGKLAFDACRRRKPGVTPLGFYTALVGALASDVDDATWAEAIDCALTLAPPTPDLHGTSDHEEPQQPPIRPAASTPPAHSPEPGSKDANSEQRPSAAAASCAAGHKHRHLTLVRRPPGPDARETSARSSERPERGEGEVTVCREPSPFLPAGYVCVNGADGVACDGVHHRFGFLEDLEPEPVQP